MGITLIGSGWAVKEPGACAHRLWPIAIKVMKVNKGALIIDRICDKGNGIM